MHIGFLYAITTQVCCACGWYVPTRSRSMHITSFMSNLGDGALFASFGHKYVPGPWTSESLERERKGVRNE